MHNLTFCSQELISLKAWSSLMLSFYWVIELYGCSQLCSSYNACFSSAKKVGGLGNPA